MKKKFVIINALMGLVVLSAILFQSIHSMEHLAKQFSEKTCHHKYVHHKYELNHSHHDWEKCFACEFTFSSSLELDTVVYPLLYNSFYFKPSFLTTSESILFYSGSSFSLRGPPIV
jgi:hypothetical protein